MTTEPTTPDANTFVARVVCSNCLTEYDHAFARGTRLDMEGYGDGRRLVITPTENGMGYFPSTKVACLHCGVAALSRKLRTA